MRFANLNRILPLTITSSAKAARIYADLRKKGQPMEHTDCLIAGIALTNKCQLVTNNTKHFLRVKGLEVVNWMQ